jgi:hypothetical protein
VTAAKERLQHQQQEQQQQQQQQQRMVAELQALAGNVFDSAAVQAADQEVLVCSRMDCGQEQQQQQGLVSQHGWGLASLWSSELSQLASEEALLAVQQLQQQQPGLAMGADPAALAAAAAALSADCAALTDQELQEIFAMIGQDEDLPYRVVDAGAAGAGASGNRFTLDMESPFAFNEVQCMHQTPQASSCTGGSAASTVDNTRSAQLYAQSSGGYDTASAMPPLGMMTYPPPAAAAAGAVGAAATGAASTGFPESGPSGSGQSCSSLGLGTRVSSWPPQMPTPGTLALPAERLPEFMLLENQQTAQVLASCNSFPGPEHCLPGEYAQLQQFEQQQDQHVERQQEQQQQQQQCLGIGATPSTTESRTGTPMVPSLGAAGDGTNGETRQMQEPPDMLFSYQQHLPSVEDKRQQLEVPCGVVPLKGLPNTLMTLPNEVDVLFDISTLDDESSWMDISAQLFELSKAAAEDSPGLLQPGSDAWDEILGDDGVLQLSD